MLPLRRPLALYVCYPLAVLVAVGVLVAALSGGQTLALGPFVVSVTSWRGLRVAAVLAGAALLLDPGRSERMDALEALLARRGVVLAALGGVALYLAAFKVRQHLSFETSTYDLALYHHAVHNTLHGRFMHAYGLERNFFSEHFSPLLLLLVPPYALLSSPLTLLVLEALGVAAAMVPLFGLCRQAGLSRACAGLVALAFAGNNVLWRSFSFDFHVELFGPLFVFAAAWAMHANRWKLFYLALALALGVKEDMVLVTAALAVLLVASDRTRWRHALGALAASALWGVLAFKLVIPASYPHAQAQSHILQARYGHLGRNLAEVVLSLLHEPVRLWGPLFGAPMRGVLSSVGGLALLDPLVLLLALPSLMLHLLSGYGPQANLDVYYALNGVTLLFLALPRVLARGQRWLGGWGALALAAFLLVAKPSAPFLRPLDAQDARGRALLAALPGGEAVSAQTTLLTHLPPETPLSVFPALGEARWVALAPSKMRWPLDDEAYDAAVRQLLAAGTYGVTADEGGFLILERGAPTTRNAAALRLLAAAAGR